MRNRRDDSNNRSPAPGESISDYVTLNDWQIQETTQAVIEADRGDFASYGEVAQARNKWKHLTD